MVPKTTEFNGRNALVTGGAAGIGFAVVDKLVSAGARVAVWDVNEVQLVEVSRLFGSSVHCQVVDVSSSRVVNDAMEEARTVFGKIDHLVNNAGIIGKRMPVCSLEDEEIDRVISVNLKSVMYVTRAFASINEAAGRSIVNISSTAARTGGMPGTSVYALTKGAIATLTISQAKELAPNIRVNALAPGIIDTEIQKAVLGDRSKIQQLTSLIPLGRAGNAAEVADAVLWLLSPRASYVTGALIPVSGGF